MTIRPGTNIHVELSATPRNHAARMTLTRLLRRDPEIQRLQRLQYRKRPSMQTWRRGGNYWHHQMKSRPMFELTPGRRFSLLASVDVIRDLESVERWVKVTPA